MTVEQWGIVIGVVVSAVLALAPWMFMVHAKLAVLSEQMARLTGKVDEMVGADRTRLPQILQQQAALTEHGRRLETLDVQLTDVGERLREMEEEGGIG
jgi:hypothetical protein